MRVEKTLSTPVAEVILCADYVIEVRMREGAVVGLPEIDAVLDAQAELMEGRVAVLVDSRPVRSMTREAQERTVNHPNNAETAAVAILISNPVSVVLGNFFIRLSRADYPTRLFRHPSQARDWLLTHLEGETP